MRHSTQRAASDLWGLSLPRWAYVGSGLLAATGLLAWAGWLSLPASLDVGWLWTTALAIWALGALAEFLGQRLSGWLQGIRFTASSSQGGNLEGVGAGQSRAASLEVSGNPDGSDGSSPASRSSIGSAQSADQEQSAPEADTSLEPASFTEDDLEDGTVEKLATGEVESEVEEQQGARESVAERLATQRVKQEQEARQTRREEAQNWPLLDAPPLEASFRGDEPIRIRFEDLRSAPSLLSSAIRRQIEHVPQRDPSEIKQASHPEQYHVRDDGPRYDLRILRSVSEGSDSQG